MQRHKRERLGFLRALQRPSLFSDIHVLFGGTGAVGGTTVFHLIEMYEELMRLRPPAPGEMPRLVVTGRSPGEIRDFTSELFAFSLTRNPELKPRRIDGRGYLLPSGILVELTPALIQTDVPGLEGFSHRSVREKAEAAAAFLAAHQLTDANPDDKYRGVRRIIEDSLHHTFTTFLRAYREKYGMADDMRFQSVVFGIPMASVAAYQFTNVEDVCRHLGITDRQQIESLKNLYLEDTVDDLARIKREEATEVLVAHTTAVGGMFDEDASGTRFIRLGFAHSAQDERLRDKQTFAEALAKLYADRNIDIMVTAAAIGIDKVFLKKVPPLHRQIQQMLQDAAKEGVTVIPESDRASQRLRCYPPATISLFGNPDEPVFFDGGNEIVCDVAIRSGENGFFSVANADALYRVMRVTSCSELAAVLSACALAGDDPQCPWFPNHVCYYTETDNSRQVFDFLAQPMIVRSQISGLSPQALQDLGSSKHQADLHTLNLLILLHRLRTLNIDAIRLDVNVEQFNAEQFFIENSRALTFEDILAWDVDELHRDLLTLVTATHHTDLQPLCRLRLQNIPERNRAYEMVVKAVLQAVWSIPSVGSPIVFENNGQTYIRACYYIAPLSMLFARANDLENRLRADFAALGGRDETEFGRFVDFILANNGFVDLRRRATLVAARRPAADMADKVSVLQTEEELHAAIARLEPYSYFTSSGLVALLARLRGLYQRISSMSIAIGTLNEYRAHFPRDEAGHFLLMPGVVEAARMVSEGLEKNTGTARLDGSWGYAPFPPPIRKIDI